MLLIRSTGFENLNFWKFNCSILNKKHCTLKSNPLKKWQHFHSLSNSCFHATDKINFSKLMWTGKSHNHCQNNQPSLWNNDLKWLWLLDSFIRSWKVLEIQYLFMYATLFSVKLDYFAEENLARPWCNLNVKNNGFVHEQYISVSFFQMLFL